jgi:hypothetical protein
VLLKSPLSKSDRATGLCQAPIVANGPKIIKPNVNLEASDRAAANQAWSHAIRVSKSRPRTRAQKRSVRRDTSNAPDTTTNRIAKSLPAFIEM